MLPWPVMFLPAWMIHLWSASQHRVVLQHATKPMLLLLLIAWYLQGSPAPRPVVATALVCGLAGDVLLMLPECLKRGQTPLFLAGLGAFLAGHLAYVAAFLSLTKFPSLPPLWLLAPMLLPVVAGLLIYRRIRTHASEPRPALVGYICVIVGMNGAAMLAAWSNPGMFALLPVAGALLFLVSDSALSLTRYGVRAFTDTFVMATYGLAQALLTCWFILMDGGRLL